MTDEFEKIYVTEKLFEQQLVRDYMQNPTPEIAKELLELAARHKTNSQNYKMTEELRQHLIDCSLEYASGTKHDKAFGTAKAMGRPSAEINHVSMNAIMWSYILSGKTIIDAMDNTSLDCKKSIDTVKAAWEKKKKKENEYDEDVRELCRMGLDVFLLMNNRTLTRDEEKIATKILKEDVSLAAIKDQQRLRTKYKDKYKFRNVNKNILNMNDEEYEKHFEDG